MDAGWLVLVLVVALALASVSVRALIALEPRQRPGRVVVLLLSAALAVSLVGTFADWDYWPVGLVVGLAVVELGPTVAGVVKTFVRRKGGDL
jgi:hypothetical protein